METDKSQLIPITTIHKIPAGWEHDEFIAWLTRNSPDAVVIDLTAQE